MSPEEAQTAIINEALAHYTTKTKLAGALGISPQQLSRYVSGKTIMSLGLFLKLQQLVKGENHVLDH